MELIQVIVRLVQLLWILLVTALIGNVIASNINASGSAEAAINFTMFVAVLSWLAALYGLATAVAGSFIVPVVLMALDGLATLFTLIAGIVLAAKLKATNCGHDLDAKKLGSGWIGFGSADNEKRCREIQASTAFLWFLFASFAVGMFFSFRSFRGTGGSVRSSGPHMSQVRV